MWGARNYNSVLKLSPEERWVQVQINFRLPQQRQSILNEDASKMLLKGPKVSSAHTHTHTHTHAHQPNNSNNLWEKSLYLNYTQDLKQCPCLPGTAFESLFFSPPPIISPALPFTTIPPSLHHHHQPESPLFQMSLSLTVLSPVDYTRPH